jgi:glycerol uptake facilitator-like aquaporin
VSLEPPDQATAPSLAQRSTAEFVGTALLLAAVVGSGIAAESLSADPGLQLLQNAIATGAVLTALILTFAGVSGAHFNPAVTLGFAALGDIKPRAAAAYIGAQISGGIVGVVVANMMFDLSPVSIAATQRTGSHLWLAEVVATLGLLLVIYGPVRTGRESTVAFAVGGYIAGAYYFTSSTSFANPAVTIARTLSDTFAGIEPASVPPFVVSQLVGTGLAVVIALWVLPLTSKEQTEASV